MSAKRTHRERIQEQERKVAREKAELERLRKQAKETERKKRTKAMIILGSVLERYVPQEKRKQFHEEILEREKQPEDLERFVFHIFADRRTR